ncbi:MAG: hypothetical protein J6O55_04710 [Lachnospiraceae bacterium]|nr:hypothetical protein [Lachnospiraceae bacterium]
MKKKFFAIALSTVILTCMLYGCAGSPQAPEEPAKEAEAAKEADGTEGGEAADAAPENGAEEDAATEQTLLPFEDEPQKTYDQVYVLPHEGAGK